MSNNFENMSVYIPHVFPNISEDRIRAIFDRLNIAKVSQVDFVAKFDRNGRPYNAVYIHFYYWHNTTAAFNLQKRILDPAQEARIVYDDPWHWVLLENTGKKHLVNGRKPRINLGEPALEQAPVEQESVVNNFDINTYKGRIDEIYEIMGNHEDVSLLRKEIEWLAGLSKELTLLEEGLEEYNRQEEIEQRIQTFEKNREEQSYVEEDRCILDPENDNHWLTHSEAQTILAQYEAEFYETTVLKPPTCYEEIEDVNILHSIVNGLKMALDEPKPKIHVDKLAHEFLDSMEEAQELWMEEADEIWDNCL
jgi:hypothetical protein